VIENKQENANKLTHMEVEHWPLTAV